VKYASVIPAIRTPFGLDVFDYAVPDADDIRAGDLILVPFRKRPVPALVVSIQNSSAFAKKAVVLSEIRHIIRFLPTLIPLLDHAASRSFSSRPTILHSWLRRIPAKQGDTTVCKISKRSVRANGIDQSTWTPDSHTTLIGALKRIRAGSRVLVLSPWQNRAEQIAKHLQCPVLHADISYALAWKTWTGFLGSHSGSCLVTTRIGAWLSHAADVIVIEEPENDDHKEDEREPRLDARFLVRTVNELRPNADVIRIGTTPPLDSDDVVWENIPTIQADISYDPWQPRGVSDIKRLSHRSRHLIEEAQKDARPIVVIDPYRDAGFHSQFAAAYPNIPVLNLPDLHSRGVPRGALAILTDALGIGGTIEDIRRKERNVIAWRRLCARIASAEAQLHVQGDESQLEEAKRWLTSDGLRAVWKAEIEARRAFHYPPASVRIKLIATGNQAMAGNILDDLTERLPQTWTVDGPRPVDAPSSRKERWIIHLVSETETNERSIRDILNLFAKNVIIDLDPIAFFR